MNDAIYLSAGSGICTTVLVILAFASAFVGIRHEFLVGVLFIVALALLGAPLFTFAREVRIALNESTPIAEAHELTRSAFATRQDEPAVVEPALP
jgi:hypothetical protein